MVKRILLIGPHGDDEVASAGFLSRSLKADHEVFIATFSFGDVSYVATPELNACLETLGIKKENSFVYPYPIRYFSEYRQPILERLVALRKQIKPHLVLIPNTMDIHQDHQVISYEGRRAFDKCSLLGYESPKHVIPTDHICYVKLSNYDFQKKMDCMNCYKSQVVRWGSNYLAYREPLARLRGTQIGCKYAEAFEVIRWIL